MSEKFLNATVILPARDVIETADFYERKLGFKAEIIWQDPPYGVVMRGNAIIEFGEGRKQHIGSGICYVHVSDADAVYSEFLSSGVEFVDGLQDRPYGCRDFRVRDNNGNILIIGSALSNDGCTRAQYA